MMQHKGKSVLITTESVATIPKRLSEEYQISTIPYMLLTEHGLFQDGIEIDARGFLTLSEDKEAFVETKVPSVEEHETFFSKLCDKADTVIHLTVSGKVNKSGYRQAQKAAESFEKVIVIDSGHVSSGQGLMAIKAARMAKEGATPETIVKKLEQTKGRIRTSFLVQSLDNMAKYKQVPKYIARFVSAMMFHPVLKIRDGRLVISKLYFGGRKRAWEKYITSAFRKQGEIDRRLLCITYVGMTAKELETIRKMAEKKCKFEKVYCQMASTVVAANCGPGTFGLSFYKKE